MENKKNLIEIYQHYFSKFFYSVFFPIILLIISYFIYKIMKIETKLLIAIDIIIILYWFFKLIVIPKNRTKKYGIVFLINNGELYNENVHLMFKKLQFELQDNFKIFVFNSNFIRKLNNGEKSKNVFFKKNYHMVINLFSLSAKINAESVCSLTNKDITFLTPVPKLDEEIIENLQKDFNLGFKKVLKLSEKNSFVDVSQNAGLLSLSIRYFVSIIYIIFNQIDLAEQQLNLMDFSSVDNNDKIVQYLRKNNVKRYAEIYYAKIIWELNKYSYLYDKNELNKLNKLIEKFKMFIESDSSLTGFRYFMNDVKAKIHFAKGDYTDALGSLIRMNKKKPNDYSVLLSKAFIETNLENVKGLETYKKISKRKDINKTIIEGCIEFINNALKNNMHNEGLLILCKGILTYYWINSTKGLEIINNSLSKINNQDIMNYVKIRFK